MKKIVLVIAIVLLLLFACTLFSSCDSKNADVGTSNEDDSQELTLRLCTAFGGTAFSKDYVVKNGFEFVSNGDSIEKVVDGFDYDAICDLLPKVSQMQTAYFDSNAYFMGWGIGSVSGLVYYGNEFTRENLNKYFDSHKTNTLCLYAKWMFYDAIRLVFFLDRDDAYFKFNIRDEVEYVHAQETLAYNRTGEYYWGLNPSESTIIMPENLSMDGWQFDDGTDLNAENLAKQTPDSQRVVKVYPRWVEEARVYFTLEYSVRRQIRSMSIRISHEAFERYHTYRGETNQNPYVLKDDFDTFVSMLPTKDDMEVWVEQVPVWDETTQAYTQGAEERVEETFERFAWKILSSDENGKTVKLDLTKENWVKYFENSQLRNISLVLDYALKDSNQTVFVCVQSEPYTSRYIINEDGSYFVLTFADEAKSNLDRFGSIVGLYVDRDNYNDLIERLPSFDTLVLRKKNINGDEEVVTNLIETAEWKFCVYSYGWFEWRIVDELEVNEQNWLALTEKFVSVAICVKYTTK